MRTLLQRARPPIRPARRERVRDDASVVTAIMMPAVRIALFMAIKLCCVGWLLLAAVGCGAPSSRPATASPSHRRLDAAINEVPMTDLPCAVTAHPATTALHRQLSSSRYFVGDDMLWAYVDEPERVEVAAHQIQADGSAAMKWPWFSKDSLTGVLAVHGRLLNPADQHGHSYELAKDVHQVTSPDVPPGIAMMVSYMVFPQAGCWEVTATRDAQTIRFVIGVDFAAAAATNKIR